MGDTLKNITRSILKSNVTSLLTEFCVANICAVNKRVTQVTDPTTNRRLEIISNISMTPSRVIDSFTVEYNAVLSQNIAVEFIL